MTKPFNDNILLDAIRHAIQYSHTALNHEAEMRELKNCHTSLTHREREVMALVVSGLLNKQVGSKLGISEITVKAHTRQGHGKNESRLPRRLGENGRKNHRLNRAQRLTYKIL